MVGLTSFLRLMAANESVDMFDDVLTLLTDTATISTTACDNDEASLSDDMLNINVNDATANVSAETGDGSNTSKINLSDDTNKLLNFQERLKWIKSLIELKGFDILICFLSASIKDRIKAFLTNDNIKNISVPPEDVLLIFDKYKL